MMPTDPTLVADLEEQAHRLDAVLNRLIIARDTLIPVPSSVWRGTARAGFDAAIDSVVRTAETGVAAITSTRDKSLIAARVVAARG